MVRIFVLILGLLFALNAAFAAPVGLNDVVQTGGVGTTPTASVYPATDVTANNSKYVTIASCPGSVTGGNNYFFSSATSNGAYQVPNGETLVVTQETWWAGAATALIPLETSTSAPTWNNTTGVTAASGIFWDTANVQSPFNTPAASTWYTANLVFTVAQNLFPFFHGNNATQSCIILQGKLTP